MSWTTYLVSLILSFPISKGRLVLLAFLNCLGIRVTRPLDAHGHVEILEDIWP